MDFKIDEFKKTTWGYDIARLRYAEQPDRYVNIIKYNPEGAIKGAIAFFTGQFLLAPFYDEMLRWFASQGYVVFAIERSAEIAGDKFDDLSPDFGVFATVQEYVAALMFIRTYLDDGFGEDSLPLNLMGHSLGGEFALGCLKYYSGISKIVVVESSLALASEELRERQSRYCSFLEEQIDIQGIRHKSSQDSIINVAMSAYWKPESPSEYSSEFTNLELFRLAVGDTSQLDPMKYFSYTLDYHYFDLSSGGIKDPLQVSDEKELITRLVSGHAFLLEIFPTAIAIHSPILHEYWMSKVLAGECKIDVPVGTNGFAIFFNGGIGPEGEQGMRKVGFKTKVLQGAHASIVHCPQSPEVWGFIKEFFENE